jgi:GNAT superfamily N-acetyltransferase
MLPDADQSPSSVVVFRGPLESDLPFIMKSWLKCAQETMCIDMIPGLWYKEAHYQACRLINRGKVLVACHIDDHSQAFGYIVYETNKTGVLAIHAIYVKAPFRSFGIARDLLMAAGYDKRRQNWLSFTSRYAKSFAKKFNLTINPFKGHAHGGF